MVDRQRVPEVAELQGGLIGTPMSVCCYCLRRPESGSHHAEVRSAQAATGGVLWSLGLEPDTPRVGTEPVAQVLAGPKISALEDQEQEARNLDFLEPTDSEDSDQHDDGRGQPLPPPVVPRGTHDISTSEDETSPPRRQDRRQTPASSRQGSTWGSLARPDSSSSEEL